MLRPLLSAIAVLAFVLTGAPPARASEGAAALPPSIRLKALMVPVVSHGRIEKYNQLEVTLELADATKLGDAQAAMPRLQDTVLGVIYKAVDEGWILRGNIVNANAFRQKIDEAGQKLIGKGVIGRVLITPANRQSSWP